MDEWKTRWLALRSSYRQGIQIKVNRRSNVCDDMEFLRPYTHVSAKSGRKNYRKGAKQKIKKEKHIAKTSKHIKREKHRPLKLVNIFFGLFNAASQIISIDFNYFYFIFLQHTNGDYENNSLAYNDSSYRMVKNETIEPNNECFEIILPDDDEAAINDELSVNTENRLQSDPFDEDLEDSDGAFGILITRELREMEPAAKREFKRTVMQLLYS